MSSKTPTLLLAASGLLSGLVAAPAHAESFASTAASSASSAGSASVASISDSVQSSSNSSAQDGNVAEGDYRVVEIAALADRPGHLQLRLRPETNPTSEPDEIVLRVPQRTMRTHALGEGDLVHVRQRPYGLEFAQRRDAGQLEPFFLALRDNWMRDLDARALSL